MGAVMATEHAKRSAQNVLVACPSLFNSVALVESWMVASAGGRSNTARGDHQNATKIGTWHWMSHESAGFYAQHNGKQVIVIRHITFYVAPKSGPAVFAVAVVPIT